MYFYNGAGIAAGDFNNDGLIDLFFASNQGQNKLYLNTGNMHFKEGNFCSALDHHRGFDCVVFVGLVKNWT